MMVHRGGPRHGEIFHGMLVKGVQLGYEKDIGTLIVYEASGAILRYVGEEPIPTEYRPPPRLGLVP